jgi:hypothetical protein
MQLDMGRAFGLNLVLGHLWAVCQVELLTYRRRQAGDGWTSEQLSIAVIEQYLDSKDPQTLPLVASGALESYCPCGLFYPTIHNNALTRQSACHLDLRDLEFGKKAAFLDDCVFVDDE